MIKKVANTLRSLSIDMIDCAKSGHIGLPLGMSDVMSVLFMRIFTEQDNFILSAGHGSALLYSILYMRGILDIKTLKQFRTHILPGHPEYGYGIDSTTGPLGQGIASGIGLALSSKEKTYIVAGDGCIMEGISLEAIAIAGHYKLNNIVLIWDDNQFTLDGSVNLSRSENVPDIFRANNWEVYTIDGHDYETIEKALLYHSDKPLMIDCKTIIGKYSPYENTSKAHSVIMTQEEIKITKDNMNMPHKPFDISEDIYNIFPKIKAKTRIKHDIAIKVPDISLDNRATREYVKDIIDLLPRDNIIYGSADLDQSTYMQSDICYGTREHAMFGIMNGIAIDGKLPISSTFLSFIDYGRAAIRIAALSKLRIIIFATHDSILLGEDGPTHQPIEHLISYRIIPNAKVFRPYDMHEMISSMQIALKHNGPSIFALSRQKIHREISGKIKDDSYIISDSDNHQLDIYASGSEIATAYQLKKRLESDQIKTRIISCFCNIEKKFQAPYSISIEYGSTFGWNHKYKIGIDTFGISENRNKIEKYFNLDLDSIYNKLKTSYLSALYQ